MKNRIREIAGELIKVAAERQLREAPRLTVEPGLYDEFAARFPYDETDDQQAAIDAVLDDLASGRPMDRLICGDVGFGKTEVALRAAFVAAMTGKQVAVVVPTTLLARQHFKTFSERFARLSAEYRASLAAGFRRRACQDQEGACRRHDRHRRRHPCAARQGRQVQGHRPDRRRRGAAFRRRPQGAAQAAPRRSACAHAHRHADPAHACSWRCPACANCRSSPPRRSIGSRCAPSCRRSTRSWCARRCCANTIAAASPSTSARASRISPTPRPSSTRPCRRCAVAVAHGQMPSAVLEDVMTAFYDGKFDVLLSTTIVESGLDIPTANTLIVHRADMFGLAQLYQLRGRVGRSKLRAYALLTLPANRKITPQAERRLKVLQSLDTLGAGFQLASHDLDIRGAGNLLGDEQSGHIKEVGYELYQQMLEEAVMQFKAGIAAPVADRWSPQITIGTPVLIPEDYVADLPVRLALYRRLVELEDDREIEAFGAELADRFGPLPDEVKYLLQIVAIKALCRRANVDRIEVGPKGALLAFRDNIFANPEGLIAYIAKHEAGARVRPDMKVVLFDEWETPPERLKGSTGILRALVAIAEKGAAKAA